MLTELKKNMRMPVLLMQISGLIVLFMVSRAVTGADGKEYNIWQILMLHGKLELTKRLEYSWPEIWKNGMGTWALLAAPVLCCAGIIYCSGEERRRGAGKFIKIRQSRLRYTFSKVLSGMIACAVTLTGAYLLFGLILLPFFPKPSDYEGDFREILVLTYGNNMWIFALKRSLGVFMMGMAMSAIPIVLGAFLDDRYLMVSLPFLGEYIYERVILKLYYIPWVSEHFDIIEAVNIENFPAIFTMQRPWIAGLMFACIIIATFVIYHLICFGRMDELV